MTSLESLYRAIIATPDEDAVRLAYADCIEERGEQGDQERAELIRVQCELAWQCSGHVAHPELTGEKWHKKVERDCPCCGLQARESNLLSPANVRRWLGGGKCGACKGKGRITKTHKWGESASNEPLAGERYKASCPCCSGTGVECEWVDRVIPMPSERDSPRLISWHRGFATVEMLPGEFWEECPICYGAGSGPMIDPATNRITGRFDCLECHGDKYRPAAPLVRLMRTGAVSGVTPVGKQAAEDARWKRWFFNRTNTFGHGLPGPIFDALKGGALEVKRNGHWRFYSDPAAAHEALARAVAGWGMGVGVAQHA